MDIWEQVAIWQLEDAFEEGFQIGLQMGNEQTVRNFLSKTDLPVERIASLVKVPIDFVEKIKADLVTK